MCPPCARELGFDLPRRSTHTLLETALEAAVLMATRSPCAKSKRGVAVFHPRYRVLGVGHNAPPPGFACDGSDACRKHCNKLCIHAEINAIRRARESKFGSIANDDVELVHIKVVFDESGDFKAVPSGEPSCWQCSREILAEGITAVWLLHETDGVRYLQAYPADVFHRQTLENLLLPVISDESTR